jgi:small subunit ribosomal protein S4
VIHRLGLAQSRAAARQLVSHGHVQVNGKACDIPSLLLKKGDTVKIKSRPRTLQLVKLNQQDHPQPIPDFLEMISNEPPEARLTRLPTRGDVDPRLTKEKELREQLIIEVCSR